MQCSFIYKTSERKTIINHCLKVCKFKQTLLTVESSFTMPSKISESKKAKNHMISLVCGMSKHLWTQTTLWGLPERMGWQELKGKGGHLHR